MADLCITILQRLTRDLLPFNDTRYIPEETLDAFIVSLESVYRELIILEAMTGPCVTESIYSVRRCLSTFNSALELRRLSEGGFSFQIQPQQTGIVGRPAFLLSSEQLRFLIVNKFSVPQIADLLGLSVRTVRRRMTEYGFTIRAQYSTMTDTELDTLVNEIQTEFPTCGNKQMLGHLLSKDHRIQQNRVRESQRRFDRNGTILRRLHVINRRRYSVPFPRSLYHIDGYHKLIRYVCSILYHFIINSFQYM